MSFKIGDKVKLLTKFYEDQDYCSSVPEGSIVEVVSKCRTEGQWIDQTSVELAYFYHPYNHEGEFELVKEKKEQLKVPKFCIGDRVISVKNTPAVPEGFIGTVVGIKELEYPIDVRSDSGLVRPFNEDELESLSVGYDKREDGFVPKFTFEGKLVSALDKQVSGNHYKDCKIQPIEYIQANGLSYLEGNVIKYTTRHSKKSGRKDIEKAIHYLELILEMEYKDKE